MTTFSTDLEALNAIVVVYGGEEVFQQTLDALNAIVVLQDSPGGFDQTIDALNEWVRLLGGTGNFQQNLAAYNEISVLSGGAGDFDTNLAALNEVAELGPPGPHIVLSGSHAQVEGTSIGTVIGTLSVFGDVLGTYSFTETADPDGAFTLTGVSVKNGIVFDQETKNSHSVTYQGNSDNGLDPVLTRTFVISVTDVAAPTLSNPAGVKTGSTTADLIVTTSGVNGTLYAVATTSSTHPTKAQVKAGQDHLGAAATFAGSQSIASSGTKTIGATGISAGTAYFDHYMHEGLPSEQSNVVSGSGFTTDVSVAGPTTWNPSDKSSDLTLSNGNLTASTSTGGPRGVRSIGSSPSTSGKYYFEVTIDALDPQEGTSIGFASDAWLLTSFPGNNDFVSLGYFDDGSIYMNSGAVSSIESFDVGDVIGVAVDFDNQNIWFRKNSDDWNSDAGAEPATNTNGLDISAIGGPGPYFAIISLYTSGDSGTANFGATPYANAAPSGFSIWPDTQAPSEFSAAAVTSTGGVILSRANFTGAADTPKGLASFWVKTISATGVSQVIYTIPNAQMLAGAGGNYNPPSYDRNMSYLLLESGSGTTLSTYTQQDDPETDLPNLTDGAWHNLIFNWDTNFAAGLKVAQTVVDGVLYVLRVNDADGAFTVPYVSQQFGVQVLFSSGGPVDIAEAYFAPGQNLDLSVPGNVAKFYSGGKPVDLGSDGSMPTGIAPLMYLSGNSTTFAANKGTGGSFEITQSFGDINGNNGAGAVSVPGAISGSSIFMVVDNGATDASSSFEAAVSVNDQVQQTSASNLSSHSLTFIIVQGALTNASTSPSD